MSTIATTGAPMEILKAALKKEQAAYAFYAEVRDHAKVEMVRELAEQLCEEEQRHIKLVEKHIARINLA